jgi:hypothetical protein
MKTTIILAMLSLSILIGCNSGTNKAFIEGTFVNHDGGSYSVADDTLVIEHANGNRYLVNRRTGFNLIRDGQKGKREYETEQWQAIYDEQNGTLTETKRGKVLSFQPDKGKLLIGSREYQKIN